GWPGPDRRGDGRAGRGQVTPVLRVQAAGAARLVGAGDLLGVAQHGVPVSAAARAIENVLPAHPQDEPRRRREQVTGKLLTLDRRLEDTVPYVLALLGDPEAPAQLAQMDPPLRRQRTFEAITRVLLRESLNQPVLLLLEDLHWLDSETEAWLQQL